MVITKTIPETCIAFQEVFRKCIKPIFKSSHKSWFIRMLLFKIVKNLFIKICLNLKFRLLIYANTISLRNSIVNVELTNSFRKYFKTFICIIGHRHIFQKSISDRLARFMRVHVFTRISQPDY